MRKFLPQISIVTICILAIGFFAVPHGAQAATGILDCGLDVTCYIFGSTNLLYGILAKVFWWGLIPLASILFSILGTVIDLALDISFSSTFYNAPAIGLAWGVIRDISNMLFIFILIYEGIRTVLNLGNLVSVRKTITSVILAAIFLNFSLFFTKVVIDVSNVGAKWFAQGITKIGGSESVSLSIGSVLKMEKVASKNKTAVKDLDKMGLDSFATGVFLFALLCVAIYVFFNFIFLIVGRIVSFMFLLITAPIGFVGTLVPMLDEYAKKWRKELSNQAMMLPMFFLLVYITLFIVDRIQSLLLTSTSGDDQFGPANYVVFIIIIMMLLKSLEVAKEYSGELGNKFADLAKSATTFVGGTALVGVVGGAARRVSEMKGVQDMAVNGGAFGKIAGKTLLQTSSFVSKSGFGAGSGYSSLLKETGAGNVQLMKDSWKGLDKGNVGRREQTLKDEQEYAKLLGKGEEGAARRQQYAKNQNKSLWATVSRQSTATKKLGEEADKEFIKERGESAKKLRNAQQADAEKIQKINEQIAEKMGTSAEVLEKELAGLVDHLKTFNDETQTIGTFTLGNSSAYEAAKASTEAKIEEKKKKIKEMEEQTAGDLTREREAVQKAIDTRKKELDKRKNLEREIEEADRLEAEENAKFLKDLKKKGDKSDEPAKPKESEAPSGKK